MFAGKTAVTLLATVFVAAQAEAAATLTPQPTGDLSGAAASTVG